MIKYAIYNMEKLKEGALYPIIITLVKITGAVVAEVGSSYLLVQAKNIVGALISFLGMSIVANIDNIMAHTITTTNIGAELSSNPIMYKRGKKSIAGDMEELR